MAAVLSFEAKPIIAFENLSLIVTTSTAITIKDISFVWLYLCV